MTGQIDRCLTLFMPTRKNSHTETSDAKGIDQSDKNECCDTENMRSSAYSRNVNRLLTIHHAANHVVDTLLLIWFVVVKYENSQTIYPPLKSAKIRLTNVLFEFRSFIVTKGAAEIKQQKQTQNQLRASQFHIIKNYLNEHSRHQTQHTQPPA